MEENKQSKLEKFLAGKGFYIVLALCIVVIGISVWSIASHSLTKELDVPEITLENDDGSEPVISETTPSPAIEDMDIENADEVGVWTQDDVWSEPQKWVWPVSSGEVSREYTIDALSYDVTMEDWRTHSGLDISAEPGEKVLAAADGTVTAVENDDLYGTTVTIDHGNGIKTVYSNLEDTPTVAVGNEVKAGNTIGAVGSTAICEVSQPPHVHVEVLKDGNSVNPLEYLPG